MAGVFCPQELVACFKAAGTDASAQSLPELPEHSHSRLPWHFSLCMVVLGPELWSANLSYQGHVFVRQCENPTCPHLGCEIMEARLIGPEVSCQSCV